MINPRMTCTYDASSERPDNWEALSGEAPSNLPLKTVTVAILIGALTVSCGRSSTGLNTGGVQGRSDGNGSLGGSGGGGKTSGGNHRSESESCPSQRGPAPEFCPPGGTCTGQPYPSHFTGLPLTCSSNSQCTAGVNGRCFPPILEPIAITQGGCSIDECAADSDCGAKTPCICRSSSTDNSANICDVGSNCAVDSDCGPGGYCSPSKDACHPNNSDPNWQAEGYSGPYPYYCHTAADLCVNDSDCAPPDAGMESCPMFASCAYNVQNSRWECTQFPCCPP